MRIRSDVVDVASLQRSSSAWACGLQIEEAADYLAALRNQPTRWRELRAAASLPGPRAIVDVLRTLPHVRVPLSDGPAGRELRAWFTSNRVPLAARAPIAVLPLPATPADYLRGRARQALRTNLRQASEAALTTTLATENEELRRAIDHLANQRGQHADQMLPSRPNLQLGVHRQLLLAYDSAGDPIGLSEILLDSHWAGLTTLVTASGHPHAKVARYALHTHAVTELIADQLDALTTHGSLLLTPPGTRYLQQRTGYQPAWLHPTEVQSNPRPTPPLCETKHAPPQ